MNTITRKYEFSAAHRIEGHPKCGRLHGHNYTVTVELQGQVAADGMVVDYGLMDVIIKPLIDAFDHRYIVSRANRDTMDPYAVTALGNGDAYDLPMNHSTAECMAAYIYSLIYADSKFRDLGVEIKSVQVDEAPKSTAKYEA